MKRYCAGKQLYTFLIVFLGALLTVVLVGLYLNEVDLYTFVPWTILARGFKTNEEPLNPNAFDPKTNLTRAPEASTDDRKTQLEKITAHKTGTSDDCEGCSKLINKVLKDYSFHWTKNYENHQKLRSLLITNCNGFQKAFVTQTNTPLGTTIAYDGEKRNRKVTKDLFNNFPKDVPFSDKVLHTCAVVGNGGILMNSSCGEAIDSAQFVIRCNLPPLENDYSKDVGRKTDLVTANPTIFTKKYDRLQGRRRAFVDSLSVYGDALLFLPAFSYIFCTDISLTVHYTLEDFRSSVRAVFMNPEYLRSVDKFWRSQGVKPGSRMSSGFMMVSLALEICNNVDVYGFWPFDNHPYGFQPLTNHYYDDEKPKKNVHAMPTEFGHLIKLHNQGVLKLHVGECPPQQQGPS